MLQLAVDQGLCIAPGLFRGPVHPPGRRTPVTMAWPRVGRARAWAERDGRLGERSGKEEEGSKKRTQKATLFRMEG
jgi:hypothetical protein